MVLPKSHWVGESEKQKAKVKKAQAGIEPWFLKLEYSFRLLLNALLRFIDVIEIYFHFGV